MKQLEAKIRELTLKTPYRVVGPVLVLLLGVIATFQFARTVRTVVAANVQLSFNAQCNSIQQSIRERFMVCESMLRSGAAYYASSDTVERKDWERFIELQSIERNVPGIQGVGFALLIPRRDLSQHILKIHAEGFPDYQVKPVGEREIYSSIIYLEPFDKRNRRAFGYDMLSEPVRRAAMELARDRNTPILSGKVQLVQENEQDVQAGVLMYNPVFRQGMPFATVGERRAALLGWVYSPYRMDNLIEGATLGQDAILSKGIRLEIFDGELVSRDRQLYDSLPAAAQPMAALPPLTLQRRMDLAGHIWTLCFTKVDAFDSTWVPSRFWLVWIGGATTSLFSSWLLFSLLNTRSQARQMAGRLITDLRASEEKFRAIADYTVGWETWFGLDGKILWVSPGAERITGYSPTEILAMPDFIATIVVPEEQGSFSPLHEKALFKGTTADTELHCIAKSGSRFWVNISWQPIFSRDGKALGIRASGRDITSLKQAEAGLRRANWVVEQSPNPIIITNPKGLIEYVNIGFTRLTGYTKAEALGKNPRFLQSGLTSPATYEDLWRNLSAGDAWRGEFHNKKKNGELYWEAVEIYPLRDPKGRITQFVGIKQDVTERKRLALALQESETRYANLAQESGTFIWEVNPQGLFTYVNSVAESVLGYRPDELEGKMYFYDLHPAAGREASKEAVLTTFAQQQPLHDLVHSAQTKKGLEVWLASIGSPRFNVEGSLRGYGGSSRNITEVRQADIALKESNKRLHLATHAGGVGVWEYNLKDKRLVWDEQMFRLYGLKKDQFTGVYAAWQNGVHPDDRHRGDQEIELALRGEKDFDTEFRVIWPNGSVHYIRALAIVQRDDSGQPLGMIGTNWDITSEKQASSALHQNETMLQLMYRSSPFGFLVVDELTDTIQHFNQHFCEIWGISHLYGSMRRGELKYSHIITDSLPVLADATSYAASCAKLQNVMERLVLEDQIAFTNDRIIRRYTTQIRDAEDQYYGRFYIYEDITNLKRTEIAIAANLEKERQVSEMKTRFISTTSHEFRTPMSTALMSADLLIKHFDRFPQPKRLEMLGRIMSSMHRMTDMLDEILTLNHLDEHRTEVNLELIDLQAFAFDLVEEVSLADGNLHRFDLQVTGDVSVFSTDPKLLRHILENLLSNAVRYSPTGTDIAIRIAGDAKGVQFLVEDHGIGIPEEDRARIFGPFERGSNVGTIQGTGLGMSIVKGMTTLLGGTIDLEAVEGGGSRFILTHPRLDEPVQST